MTVFSTAGITLTSASCAVIPGLEVIVDMPANAVLFVSADGGVQLNSASSNNSLVEFRLVVDDVSLSPQRRVTVSNSPVIAPGFTSWALSRVLPLPPGPHKVAVCGQRFNGEAAFSGGATTMGELSVLVLKK